MSPSLVGCWHAALLLPTGARHSLQGRHSSDSLLDIPFLSIGLLEVRICALSMTVAAEWLMHGRSAPVWLPLIVSMAFRLFVDRLGGVYLPPFVRWRIHCRLAALWLCVIELMAFLPSVECLCIFSLSAGFGCGMHTLSVFMLSHAPTHAVWMLEEKALPGPSLSQF